METCQLKLKELKGKIKEWNWSDFDNIHQEKRRLEHAMLSIQQKIILEGKTKSLVAQEGEVLNDLKQWRKQEEILWRQK